MRGKRSTYPHRCRHATCQRSTHYPYCDYHAREYAQAERDRQSRRQAARPSSSARGYDGAWTATRRAFLAHHPLCATIGCTNRADVVDHITPIRRGGTNDVTNLQSLCYSCHMSKTRREQADDRRVAQQIADDHGRPC